MVCGPSDRSTTTLWTARLPQTAVSCIQSHHIFLSLMPKFLWHAVCLVSAVMYMYDSDFWLLQVWFGSEGVSSVGVRKFFDVSQQVKCHSVRSCIFFWNKHYKSMLDSFYHSENYSICIRSHRSVTECSLGKWFFL